MIEFVFSMKILKLHVLAIFFMLPFLGSDLYSKYLAHQHLTEKGDQVVINDYVYAGLPLRNYGWIGSEYPVEVNSFTNISGNIIRPLVCVFIYWFLFSLDAFWARLNGGICLPRVDSLFILVPLTKSLLDNLLYQRIQQYRDASAINTVKKKRKKSSNATRN